METVVVGRVTVSVFIFFFLSHPLLVLVGVLVPVVMVMLVVLLVSSGPSPEAVEVLLSLVLSMLVVAVAQSVAEVGEEGMAAVEVVCRSKAVRGSSLSGTGSRQQSMVPVAWVSASVSVVLVLDSNGSVISLGDSMLSSVV